MIISIKITFVKLFECITIKLLINLINNFLINNLINNGKIYIFLIYAEILLSTKI